MHKVFTLKNETNLSGVKLNKLKAKDLSAASLLAARKYPADSAEFEKSMILSVFYELCDDDFEHIHISDYLRMREVIEEMISPADSIEQDKFFLQ